jgi:hypothetical protein
LRGTVLPSAPSFYVRYFFHLHSDVETQDEEGVDLPDEAAARDRAEDEARMMAAASVQQGYLNLSDCIHVTDKTGRLVLKVLFGDVVKLVH